MSDIQNGYPGQDMTKEFIGSAMEMIKASSQISKDRQITVENVVPYVQYTVSGGKTPAAKDQADIATGLSRQAGKITLTVANPGENRFFKVVNK